MKLFNRKIMSRGDWDGFFAFGMDAMLAFLLMGTLLTGFLGFPAEMVYTRILPAAAMGLLVGNGFYAWQAVKLARREGRDDVCAIPFGTSTLTLIVIVILVMYPVKQQALAGGMDAETANILAWHVGLLAGAFTGFIEFAGSFVVYQLRRIVPRPVMLVAIAGTGISFLTMNYAVHTFGTPLVGFVTLSMVIVFFFSNVKLRGGIPGGFVIVAVGTALAWMMHGLDIAHLVPGPPIDTSYFGLNLPRPEAQNVWSAIPQVIPYLPLIAPFGFIFLIGSLQNIEAAAAAGDSYEPQPLLIANGISSLIAAAFGSPFPTSIFVGHPGYKRIGARTGYTLVNSLMWTVVCFTGTLSLFTFAIPVEAVMALIVWIGLVVFAQNFEITDKRHYQALAMGLLPAIAAFATQVVRNVLSAAGAAAGTDFMTRDFALKVAASKSFHLEGLYALGEGYLYSSMILCAITLHAIDHQFRRAAGWALGGAALSALGLIHSIRYANGDILTDLHVPVPQFNMFVAGYLGMAVVLALTPFLTERAVVAEAVPAE